MHSVKKCGMMKWCRRGGGGSPKMGKEGHGNQYEVLCPQNLPTTSLCVSVFLCVSVCSDAT